jgi:hypothetical protein
VRSTPTVVNIIEHNSCAAHPILLYTNTLSHCIVLSGKIPEIEKSVLGILLALANLLAVANLLALANLLAVANLLGLLH